MKNNVFLCAIGKPSKLEIQDYRGLGSFPKEKYERLYLFPRIKAIPSLKFRWKSHFVKVCQKF